MTNVLSKIKQLRSQGDHYRRRLTRMEFMAAGGRVDYDIFAEARAYVEGLAKGYEEALEIIGDGTVGRGDIDPCVIQLAREGLDVEAIAARCGLTEREVAENLIRHVEASVFGDRLAEPGEEQT